MWNRPQLMMAISELLFVIAGAALFVAAIVWCARLPLFPLSEVVVVNSLKQVQYDDLEEALSRELNGNFFSVDIDALRASVEKIAWVRHAEIRRRWPGKIEVDIEEHTAVAFWGDDTGQWVNTHGEIFMAAAIDPPEEMMPVFLGPDGLASEMLDFYLYAKKMLKTIDREPKGVAVSQRLAVQMQLDDAMIIEFGRRQSKVSINERLQRFVDYYPSILGAAKRPPSVVDMRYPSGFALRQGTAN